MTAPDLSIYNNSHSVITLIESAVMEASPSSHLSLALPFVDLSILNMVDPPVVLVESVISHLQV